MADVTITEHQVVAAVWGDIQNLLGCGETAAEAIVRNLTAMLPDPSSFSSGDLPVLVKLHLSSAHNLMATLKLLAPAAFARGSSQPDLSALDDADSSLLGMAATLIELQLFHLQRAAALTAASRNRLAQGSGLCHMGTTSSCNSSCADASMPIQLLDLCLAVCEHSHVVIGLGPVQPSAGQFLAQAQQHN